MSKFLFCICKLLMIHYPCTHQFLGTLKCIIQICTYLIDNYLSTRKLIQKLDSNPQNASPDSTQVSAPKRKLNKDPSTLSIFCFLIFLISERGKRGGKQILWDFQSVRRRRRRKSKRRRRSRSVHSIVVVLMEREKWKWKDQTQYCVYHSSFELYFSSKWDSIEQKEKCQGINK